MTDYRVGIIGTGRVASKMEESSDEHPVTIAGAFDMLPNTQLVAGCNRGAAGLKAFGERWGVTALYHNYREMLEREALDIVAVATHPPLHAQMVEAACASGVKGIFCEKPMALDLRDCDRILDACAKSGTTLLVNCTRRWSGQYEAVRQLVASGQLGPLYHIVAHCQGAKPTPDWVADTEGPLLHDAVHTFDSLRFFAGDVASVIGTATRRQRLEFRVEDTSYSLLQFESGVDAVVISDELTTYSRFDIELQCERGVVRLETNPGLWEAKLIDFEKGNWWVLEPGEMPQPTWSEPVFLRAARDLVECMETGRQPRCNGLDGRKAVEIITAIYESERRGNTRVSLPVGVQESLVDVLRREGKL
ncbi:MAG: Gfo/Idh/MocA family oxidoreductase [Anaerolineae bacterium]|nr:Gfo/Idh/MocA family oxidoreductase [Anaerolineae bacterium]